MKTSLFLLSVFLFFADAEAAHAEWFANAGLGAVYESNLNRTVDKEDRKADFAAVPHMSFGNYIQLADLTRLTVNMDIQDTGYARYNGLDNLAAAVTVSVKYKTGFGSYVPWIKGYAAASFEDYREGFRDKAVVRTGLVMGKRVQERVFAQIGYEYETARARNALFDTRSNTVSIKADYLLTESALVWLGFSVRSGTLVLYEALDEGDAASPGTFVVNTFTTPMEAYHVHADSHTLSIGVSKAFDLRWSADIIADFCETHAEGKNYPDSLYKAGILYSY